MKRTIELTPKYTKWIFIFNGIVNTAIGINMILQSNTWMHWTSIVNILLIIGGPVLFVYGIILFGPFKKLTPKVQVDDQGLFIKKDIHKKEINIDWANVKEITYKSFELDFLLNDNNIETVNLPTTAAISIEIKNTVRKFSDEKQIKIIGG
jgi:hypothetical protein